MSSLCPVGKHDTTSVTLYSHKVDKTTIQQITDKKQGLRNSSTKNTDSSFQAQTDTVIHVYLRTGVQRSAESDNCK